MTDAPAEDTPAITVTGIDHVVVYADDAAATSRFYADLLDADRFEYGPGWWSVRFSGGQLNFRPAEADLTLASSAPTAGAVDVCLVTDGRLEGVVDALRDRGVEPAKGPVDREGSRGAMTSVYFHGPEGNLVEVASYD